MGPCRSCKSPHVVLRSEWDSQPANRDRREGLTKLAEGALLLVDAAKAFELGMHTTGSILVGRATEAVCEGARLLGVAVPTEGTAQRQRAGAFDHSPQFVTLLDGTLAPEGWSDHRAGPQPGSETVRAFVEADGRADSGGWRLPERGAVGL
jgi:hypothetical protein